MNLGTPSDILLTLLIIAATIYTVFDASHALANFMLKNSKKKKETE